ncbi:hypothetical protein COCC4DRAFT_149809 [Bipolaris maydis ATCC 48331]|uniref:Uncharacterized protein n=2 Tax=Cochliobolus heterostrophus TaxID=5016 RepID=M2UK87_COCH5|nr:uncharacterized protein COCC4DRAFT_149809 [Bipolaris maydis ATCC 48331]EMD88403.1 hypothetical protein COCHEDRAFT_1110361 [Bipolaris maydis C5]KAJ5028395.1 hypothetical protein J3E73DRAFT_407260 [Bipolaris maydis]ENI00757.1 hypothetical protein COCC4DRAFT_149809 [Bipolaris maydis ATCC 48331]KAJ5063166.1 hypothetical protein J3E74DRAFT_445576 [Bipolaris maydis]KAJ6205972.1 hypothetical protein PSV09DRAFT_1110361 [Bipolaris maydis]
MPIAVRSYILPPTPQIPNSPHPLLHYPGLLKETVTSPTFTPTHLLDLYAKNGWQTQWIAKYGPDIQSHYHSTTHEAMTVISGAGAIIRFGVADAPDWQPGMYAPGERGENAEPGGLDIEASIGDVFIIPAGVAHKTFAPRPASSNLAFHQPKDIASGAPAEVTDEVERERRTFFDQVAIKGEFMMMGAYPYGNVWDFKIGGERGREQVWGVPLPELDPILGGSDEGLVGLWH